MNEEISYSPYALVGIKGFQRREGALLRVKFTDGTIGFADCHPWVSLGDLPISDQLECLKQGLPTQLGFRSLEFARLDAQARKREISLFSGLSIPTSHLLIPNLQGLCLKEVERFLEDGITCFKVKLGKDLEYQLPILVEFLKCAERHAFKVRLDFNCNLTLKQFEGFCDAINPWCGQIDFYEDPIPFDAAEWSKLKGRGVVACDLHSEKALGVDAAALLVVKPAVQSLDLFGDASKKLVVTSYLDHPLGQLCAAYVAAKVQGNRLHGCGLLTHLVYEATEFSEQLGHANGCLKVSEGTGFGFDELLSKQPWQKV
ncbi:MAG: hypothetical protein H0X51_06645 [Parachlamydiaceae bacterium]|nr:hypothetical protein [Parachlamydiaceae bacterium]